jgi:putative membrane protein
VIKWKINTKTMLVLLTLASVIRSGGVAMAQGGQYGNGGWGMGPGMMGNWGMGWFGGIFMMIFWVLIIVGLVFLIKWLIQSTRSEKSEAGGGRRALEILKERYARSEIDKAEFEEKRKDLT